MLLLGPWLLCQIHLKENVNLQEAVTSLVVLGVIADLPGILHSLTSAKHWAKTLISVTSTRGI